jgi:hypothetical protein
MLKLDVTNEPRWLELASGVKVKVRPLSTSVMAAARSDPALDEMPADASNEVRAVVLAKAIARIAVLEWDGVGDEAGEVIPVTPEGVSALLDVWPIFEQFQMRYVAKALLLEQEKNGLALSPIGTSEGA